MLTHNLGYPRIGTQRELKKACENYWAEKTSLHSLLQTGDEIRRKNWLLQQSIGIDLVPSNDFSYYDQVLDMSLMLGAIPERFHPILLDEKKPEMDLYFGMARGYQKNSLDITPLEMTKWFNTNYHYLVPEFKKNQTFKVFSTKVQHEFSEAKRLGLVTKPVLIGPVSYLLLGKEKESGFHRLELIQELLPVYIDILKSLEDLGAEWIQLDEPFLVTDLDTKAKDCFEYVYKEIRKACPDLKIILATYFDGLEENAGLAVQLPVCALHLDLIQSPDQLKPVLEIAPVNLSISLGLVDGRNIWKNDLGLSLQYIQEALQYKAENRLMVAPSCSLLHSPCDLEQETGNTGKLNEIHQWLAFAKQKLEETVLLKNLGQEEPKPSDFELLEANKKLLDLKQETKLVHNKRVKERAEKITEKEEWRNSPFAERKIIQQQRLQLPVFPTTTIGSFPQTPEVRRWRAKFKKGTLSTEEYDGFMQEEIRKAIAMQEEIGLDVLVHGEFERNDMVEYFGEQLHGFAFTQNGWVQSYGSRCVKPPVIYGDVHRPDAMTVKWSGFAQSLTGKKVKGMLTGPVTILQWSFVRNDQSRETTCKQIALAIRDEVKDLEDAGIHIIQIDEPALREGLPLRRNRWKDYLRWAISSFRISSTGINDSTQIHTHMCYSEFNDIMNDIVAMDADVITIECSRSQMELLDSFVKLDYPNDIGPGVYDIHSPRIPTLEEITDLLDKACKVLPYDKIWVNPDCGLKTREWEETKKALKVMVSAAREQRKILQIKS